MKSSAQKTRQSAEIREQGYYSLVQFCPDPARAEVANLGVLLFSPAHDFTEVALSRSTRRVKTIFPRLELDTTQIKSMQRWLKDRLEVERDRFRTKDDLTHFIETRFNDVRLTAPRSIAVERPQEQLKALFEELVAMPKKEEQEPLPRVPFPRVDRFFRTPGMVEYVVFDKKVTIPVWERQIDIPYVFTNGIVHNVKPQFFASVEAAANLAVEGRLLAKHARENGKRQEFYILPKAKPSKLEIRDKVIGVLKEMEGDGVSVVPEDEIPAFLDLMRSKV